MCRRKFVWRQGTKYVVGLQKYWVTSKTVGSQHFPEALHVFQPSGLVGRTSPNQKGGIPERVFSIVKNFFVADPRDAKKSVKHAHSYRIYRLSRGTRSRRICRETEADSADKRKTVTRY